MIIKGNSIISDEMSESMVIEFGQDLFIEDNLFNSSKSTAVNILDSTRVIIKNNKFEMNIGSGISFGTVKDSEILNNSFNNNPVGITLIQSYQNNLTHNLIKSGTVGINLLNSTDNLIKLNEITDQRDGIILQLASNSNVISQNLFKNISESAIDISNDSINNTIFENTPNASPSFLFVVTLISLIQIRLMRLKKSH